MSNELSIAIRCLSSGDALGALEKFNSLLSHQKHHATPDVYYGQALAHAALKNSKEAVIALKTFLSLVPNHEEAKAILDELEQTSVTEAQSYLALARSRLAEKRFREARFAFEKYISFEPNNREIRRLIFELKIHELPQAPRSEFEFSKVSIQKLIEEKSSFLKKCSTTICKEHLCKFELSNPYLIGRHGLVLSADKQILREQSHGMFVEGFDLHETDLYCKHISPLISNAYPLAGEYLSLLGPWTYNFYHWCLEILPQVLLAEKLGFKGSYIVEVENRLAKDTLELLGIDSKRVFLFENISYTPEVLWTFNYSKASELTRYPELIDLIREKVLSKVQSKNTSRRVYISRGSDSRKCTRVVLNEQALRPILSKFGFEFLQMERLSLREQIEIMADAEAVLAPHGAGMTHTVFMKPNSLVIELFSPEYINPCYAGIHKHLKHQYYLFPSLVVEPGKNPFGRNIQAPLELIEMTLERELLR